jgi:hypothetical protein
MSSPSSELRIIYHARNFTNYAGFLAAIFIFCVILRPEDGGNMFLGNIG